jgi:hypothetical protein
MAAPVRLPIKYSAYVADDRGESTGSARCKLVLDESGISLDNSAHIAWSVRPTIEPHGPGFAITWRTPGSLNPIVAILTYRTFFGYDTAKRDETLVTLRQCVAQYADQPATVPARLEACEVCQSKDVVVWQMPVVLGYAFSMSSRLSERAFCRKHSASPILWRLFGNALGAALGIHSFGEARSKGADVVARGAQLKVLTPKKLVMARLLVAVWPVWLALFLLVCVGGPLVSWMLS